MKFNLLLLFLGITLNSLGQTAPPADCYEIKYLDFFGLEDGDVIKWPDSELKGLLAIDFEKDNQGSPARTNFLIPLIVYQLKEYHPNCISDIDTLYFNKISEIYYKIRGMEAPLPTASLAERIDLMRADFYRQVQDDSYLPKMTYTLDDGPFYGVDTTATSLVPVAIKETDFGSLEIAKAEEKIVLTSKDNEGNPIWQKIITGLGDRNLEQLSFTEYPLEYNSVATIASLFSGGERFRLYLKKDGNFMYYFHSW